MTGRIWESMVEGEI